MDFSSILQPLKLILLRWIGKYPLTTQHRSLIDLVSAEFFSYMLERVEAFQWIEREQWVSFKELSTGEKVKRMRIVGRSITRYYQSKLDLSLDSLAFNYIEMCAQSQQSSILRFFIAVLGVMVRSPDIMEELQQFMGELDSEQSQLFRIMINYTARIGEKISSGESPSKNQKRLVSKLQSLEQQQQFYSEYVNQLETKVYSLTEQLIGQRRQVVELRESGDRLSKRIQNLELVNQELTRQLNIKTKQAQLLQAKLSSNRQSAQDIVDRLLQQNEKERKDINYLKQQLADRLKIESELRKMIDLNQRKEQSLEELKNKIVKQNQHIQMVQKELKETVNNLQHVSAENQGLKTKVILLEKKFANDRIQYLSPDQQSIIIPNTLGDSYLQKTPQEWFAIDERRESNESFLSDSLSFSQPTEGSLFYPKCMGFLSISELQKSFQSDKENHDPNVLHKQMKLADIEEERSMEISQRKTIFSSEQLELSMSMIFDLHSSLQSTRKQLLSYKAKEASRVDRTARFAAKINDMFA